MPVNILGSLWLSTLESASGLLSQKDGQIRSGGSVVYLASTAIHFVAFFSTPDRSLDLVFRLHCHVTFTVLLLSSGLLQLQKVGIPYCTDRYMRNNYCSINV